MFKQGDSRLCTKLGIQERGTECGELGEWVECYIVGSVLKYSGECRETFRGMSPNIMGNFFKQILIHKFQHLIRGIYENRGVYFFSLKLNQYI